MLDSGLIAFIVAIIVIAVSVNFGPQLYKWMFPQTTSDTKMGGGRRSNRGMSRGQIGGIVVAVIVVVYLCNGSNS